MKVTHKIEFETEFILENMSPSTRTALANLSAADVQRMCNGALLQVLNETAIVDKVNEGSSWGILKVVGGAD